MSFGYSRPVATLTPLAARVPVSVVIPVLNEEKHLSVAVESILNNGYDHDIEVVLALGPSSDGTDTVAAALAADPRVTLVPNPTGSTPVGLNLAIDATRYDVVVRVDGHTALPVGYIAAAVVALRNTGAANVGGRMVPTASAPLAGAVAVAMQSRWGIGGAGHRIGGAAGPADSVFLGSFRKEALAAVGGFDEHFRRAQDWELNYRLRAAGYLVWFEPSMQVPYAPRGTWSALARQFYHSGRWRREVASRYPETVSARYLAAPLVVVAVVLGTVLALAGLLVPIPLLTWGFVAPLGYAAGVVVAAASHGRSTPLRSLILLPGVLAIMHLAWGAGFMRGIR